MVHFKIAGRQRSIECSHHEEMKNICGDAIYPI
jgi:hypothetical protein